MSDTSKDRHVICYFGIINLCGIMDTKDSLDSDYSEVILPLFSHESYTIKTTFNRNLEYKNTYMTDSDGNVIYDDNGNPRHLKSDTFAIINVPKQDNHPLAKFQGKYYQKKFRREVLWDFGDGTTKTGYSAEHSYKKPGRYKITCTFFDINRKAWVNDYSIYVIVKEVFPTILRFDTSKTKSEITCSKIERVAKVEALNSNMIDDALTVNIKRVFSESEHEHDYEEIGADYASITPTTFKFMERYWTFLANSQVLFYNSDKVYSEDLSPCTSYSPKYNEVFGKFYFDELNENMGISLYQVIPYKNIDDDLKTVKILDPNSSILNSDVENWIEVPITHVYTDDQLPSGVFSVGKRGWFDIFYKNDFIGNPNVFSIFYDIEKKNITGELDSAPNYLNLNPLGLTINVKNNTMDNIRIGMSLDGFLRPMNGEDISDGDYFIDQHLYNSLFSGIDLDVYIYPYITYDGDNDIVADKSMYYVPKDISVALYPEVKTISGNDNYSFVNHGGYIRDGEIVQYPMDDYILGLHSWFYRVPLILRNYINIKFKNTLNVIGVPSKTKQIDVNLVKKSLVNTKSVIIPKETQKKQDLNRLLDAYMSHPMFQETPNVRDMMKSILDNGYLSDILTSSENFLDNTANVKRCYLSNLISTLQMMGEDVTLFEKGAFEGVNELKNFVRFLTMNHTELVGHVIDEDMDITVRQDLRGKNVGEEISLSDVLSVRYDATEESLGKIYKIKKTVNGKTVTRLIGVEHGVDIIAHDRYTHDTKIVTFNGLQMSLYHKQKEEYDKEKELVESQGGTMPPFTPSLKQEIKLSEYDESWGWNLLLPDSFGKIGKKINQYKQKISELQQRQTKMTMANARVRVYSLSQMDSVQDEIDKINREIDRLKNVRKDLIDGYYTFHLLNPKVSSKRIGNFIDGDYITQRLESTDDWNDVWGITHEILMKIMLKNGSLYNNRGFDTDGGKVQTTFINIKKDFSQTNEVESYVIVDGEELQFPLRGELSITGEILNSGSNALTVSLNGGLLDEKDHFYISTGTFDCIVTEDNEITHSTQTYNVYGERVSGRISVTIGGTISDPTAHVRLDLKYNPIILSGSIVESTAIKGIVYEESFVVEGDELKGFVNLTGDITGTGNNTLLVSFTDVELSRNNGTLTFPATVIDKEVNVVVANDGTINTKDDEFEVSGNYENGTFSGLIRTTIKGTVKNPELIVSCSVRLVEFVDLLPDEYIQKVYDDMTSGKLCLLTSFNESVAGVELPYYINDFKIHFVKDENGKMIGSVTGTVTTEKFDPDTTDFSWKNECVISLTNVPFNINPTTGEIEKTSFDVPLIADQGSNQIFNRVENEDGTKTVSDCVITCTVDGNMLQNNVTVTLEEKAPIVGMYAIPFDYDKVYDRTDEGFENIFNIDGYTEYDKVRIYFTSVNKMMIDGPYSDSFITPIMVTVEYIRCTDIPEHEEIDDEGNVTIVEATTEETVGFVITNEVQFNGVVTVDENCHIKHDPITVEFHRDFDQETYTSGVTGELTIVSDEMYKVSEFRFSHITSTYLFYSASKKIKDLMVSNPTDDEILGEFSVHGGGDTNSEITFTSNYDFVWGYYDDNEDTKSDGNDIVLIDEGDSQREYGDEENRELNVISAFGGSFENTVEVGENGKLKSPITNFIQHINDDEYGLEGSVTVDGGADGVLDITSDDLELRYLPGESEQIIDIKDYEILGLANMNRIIGQLVIRGSREGKAYTYTISDNDSFSYNGVQLSDENDRSLSVEYGFDKQITSPSNTIDINYSDGNSISLVGTFVLSGEVKNLTVEGVNLRFTNDGPVEVWIDFNDIGEIVDADLGGLESGYYMFFGNDKIGQRTDDDGVVQVVTFEHDLGSLIYGSHMFAGCGNLKSFITDISCLKSGYHMFDECKLNEDSLRYISDILQYINDLDIDDDSDWRYSNGDTFNIIPFEERGRIDIGLDETVSVEALIECGNLMLEKGWVVYINEEKYKHTYLTSPYDITEANGYSPVADQWHDDIFHRLIKLGYELRSVSDGYVWGIEPDTSFNVTEENGYIDDATLWNEEVYVPNSLKIVRVIDGVAYDE